MTLIGLLFLFTIAVCSACSTSMTAETKKTKAARLKPEPGFSGRDLKVETWPVWVTPESSPKRRLLALYINDQGWPKHRYKLERAILRLRLKTSAMLNQDGHKILCTWRPKVITLTKALEIQQIDGGQLGPLIPQQESRRPLLSNGRITHAKVVFDPQAIWKSPARFRNLDGDPRKSLQNSPGPSYFNLKVARSVQGLETEEVGQHYLELIKSWNSTIEAPTKQNGLWLEILVTTPLLENQTERAVVILLEGDVRLSGSDYESYFLKDFPAEHLRPHVHLILSKRR